MGVWGFMTFEKRVNDPMENELQKMPPLYKQL